MDNSTWALLLLATGVVLLIAEVFIPSGGLIAVMATLSFLGAIWCAANAWWTSHPTYFWGFMAGISFLIPVLATAGLAVWPHTPIGRRAILEAPTLEEVTPFADLSSKYAKMVGRIGETVTMMNPAGIVRVDGERVHCQSEGVVLDVGIPVRIISAQGLRLIVRECSREAQAEEQAKAVRDSEDRTPLDFDIS